MKTYIPPRVTFVGSDPKIPALRRAIKRVSSRTYYHDDDGTFWEFPAACVRFAGLWQARNRRTRVLMWKVRNAQGQHDAR